MTTFLCTALNTILQISKRFDLQTSCLPCGVLRPQLERWTCWLLTMSAFHEYAFWRVLVVCMHTHSCVNVSAVFTFYATFYNPRHNCSCLFPFWHNQDIHFGSLRWYNLDKTALIVVSLVSVAACLSPTVTTFYPTNQRYQVCVCVCVLGGFQCLSQATSLHIRQMDWRHRIDLPHRRIASGSASRWCTRLHYIFWFVFHLHPWIQPCEIVYDLHTWHQCRNPTNLI